MTAPSAADRAKPAEIVTGELDNVGAFDHSNDEARDRESVTDAIAAALAAERAAAVERLTTDLRALAEFVEGVGFGTRPPHSLIAARLRAVVADAGEPDTSSEEEQ